MTTNHTAADSRRAAALVSHYSIREVDGCNVVMREAMDTGRVAEMITALCDLFQRIVPALVTGYGMALMSEHVLIMADDDEGDLDVRRAAQLIAHHGNNSREGINKVLTDADDEDRVTELVLAVLNLYETLLPSLYAPTGLRALQQTAVDFAAQEENS